MRLTLALAGLLLLGTGRPARAQFQIGPTLGFHAPSSSFHLPGLSGQAEGKQHLAFMYGGEARIWFDRRAGVEASLTRGTSDIIIKDLFTGQRTVPASVTVGTLSALLRFPLGDLSNRAWLSGGAVLVRHGGKAFDGYGHTSNLGAALGLGTQFQLSTPLRLDLGFQTLIYNLALSDSLGTLPGRVQVDFGVRLGLALSLGADQDDF